MNRLNFEESWKFLRENTNLIGDGPMPSKIGQAGFEKPDGWLDCYKCPDIYDNGEYKNPEDREMWRLENLTMPGVFFCRSGIYKISFRNTSLINSSFCWNDFINVDFTGSNLSRCDLRCSLFHYVLFTRANLTSADLRSSTFTECDFSGAQMQGAKLTLPQANDLVLTEEQRAVIEWKRGIGRQPGGG